MPRRRLVVGVVAGVAGLVLAMSGVALAAGQSTTGVGPLASTAGCGKAPALTSGSHTISSGGQNRSYILRIPDNYDYNRPYKLIFGFHWNGGTAGDVDSGGTSGYPWSYYGVRALANNSAIFVAPQGNGNGWANPNGQDLTFVDDMVRTFEAGLCVDTTQRYAMGFSYGGGMSYALACARATVFRAVAVYSGANLSGCNGGTQPIAYLGIHGLRDGTLPISAGRSLRDQFVRNNGCTPQSPPEPAQGSLTHVVTYYSGCRAGYPVAWAAFDGPHAPNAVDGTADPFAPGERSWTQAVVWRFFTQFDGTTPTNPPTTPPPTTPPPTSARQLAGEQSGRCVTAPGQSSGTQVQLQDCAGQSGQLWTATSGRQLQLAGNLCLDASGAGTANGTAVIVWACNGQPNQQWNVNANGTVTGVQSGLCLDANGQGTANGTRLVLWSCNGGANQRWSWR
ncbi:ricin-type beta-trefoil lectin domain protein [Micromonospora sp. RP3T]|uniref:ricin-type beta-trefoil lectin domain protein n=1 Tax=Micromonospora sp. RP3T TaxID=2135446 RepID=UPI000D179905|nr:ricin-type beta-trefoil lectin domain protein [Micromonospora sp. RP3T]PTA46602.1 poly(3-hydroxybutyrate) depolymerase [Micromonospora sp. RP3T]